jgi:cytosine/adenosine deaminase-related metal-dependent hydrolase
MQTHVAENRAEVRWVAELFPEARSYLDVYAPHGLLHRARVLAHGIWLDADDRALLRDSGAQIAFCPSSNLFLGSGLFDWRGRARRRRGVSVASDVGGGTSLSMQRTLADGYKVQALRGTRLTPGRRCMPPPAAPRRRWAWPRDRAPGPRCHGRPGVWDWAPARWPSGVTRSRGDVPA